MRAVPYGLELPFDRAPHYAAAICEECHDFDDLKLVDGTFKCVYCRGEREPFLRLPPRRPQKELRTGRLGTPDPQLLPPL